MEELRVSVVLRRLLLLLIVFAACLPGQCAAGVSSRFLRDVKISPDMSLDSDVFAVPPGYNAPQQVHITQGDHDGKAIIVTWVTMDEAGSSEVRYGKLENSLDLIATGKYTRYKYINYTSGYIHHCFLKNLEFSTKYFYEIGIGFSIRKFWFETPPKVGPDVPYTFGVIGDLGQTYASNMTLTHYQMNLKSGQTVLFLGDLSYADTYPEHDSVRWDTWGRFTERSTAYQPWIWTTGNHEIDIVPEFKESKPFKPFTHRYYVPYEASGSTEQFWYSIKRASAYIIVLSSYSPYAVYTPQHNWLQEELPKVNRSETPWLVILFHVPFYTTYNEHYMEGESMRVLFEAWFVKFKVDVVFSGHVHAYERTERISNIAYNIVNGKCTPVPNPSAPIYITLGDGGNIEGLITSVQEPQPKYSAFRESSFGHGIFDIKNRTHAHFSWHRNQDAYAIEADSTWIYNRVWNSVK